MGSSANTTAGRVTSARAIATRCCWPPDSSDGRCLRRSASPTVSISVSTHAWSMSRPAIVSGRVMFSSAVRTGSRLKAWKMKPIFSRRRSVRRLSSSVVISMSVDLDGAGRGPVEAREAVHQRRLAGSRRSHDRAVLATHEADRDAVEGVDRGLAVPEDTCAGRWRRRSPSSPSSNLSVVSGRTARAGRLAPLPAGLSLLAEGLHALAEVSRAGTRTTGGRSTARAQASRIAAGTSTSSVDDLACSLSARQGRSRRFPRPARPRCSSTASARHDLVHEPDLLRALGRRRCGR